MATFASDEGATVIPENARSILSVQKEPVNDSSLADSTVHVCSMISLFFVLQMVALLAALPHKSIHLNSFSTAYL